ncbi:MAG TPA: NADH-quinone oxidoreductase subunit N [Planctomycetota bacterium]|nr:NADH-quinone oxidoreductase subunit N [Planctomycetota bacterium]
MTAFQMTMPLLILVGGATAILLFGASGSKSGARPLPPALTLLTCAAALIALFALRPETPVRGLDGFVFWDPLGVAGAALAVFATGVLGLLAGDYLKKADANHAEFYALALFAAAGMVVMTLTDHLVSVFLGLEVMSLSLYVLCAMLRGRATSTEAGIKYFLAGSFASAIFIMGLALLFGATGRLDLPGVASRLSDGAGPGQAGAVLLLGAFAFKLALAPFHQWTPDVYEGAPTPVTGYMSVAVKAAAFTAFFRLVRAAGPDAALHGALAWLAALTMLVGNLGALAQTSVKRMLAYSSIGHAGYLLLAPIADAPGSSQAAEAMTTYLTAYALTNLLAFGALSFLETREGAGLTFEELRGARWRRPLHAVALCVAMLSLAGAPPTAGFLAKFRLFGAVLERGRATGESVYYLLTAVAVVTSLAALGYYLRVIVTLYFSEPQGSPANLPRFSPAHRVVLAALAAAVLWLGVGPAVLGVGAEALFGFARDAAGG